MSVQQKLMITETEPTAIVKDFMAFVTYAEKNEIQLTKRQGWLSRKDLQAINARMTEPESGVTAYSDQRAYPLLTLFYHLALAAKLLRTAPHPSGNQTLLPTDRLPLFRSLNAAEKYISLLEAFWVDADWSAMMMNNYSRGLSFEVREVFRYLAKLPPGSTLDERNDTDKKFLRRLWDWGYIIHYFRYFGFWATTKSEALSEILSSKFAYLPSTLTPTPLFYTLCMELYRSRDFVNWNLPLRYELGDWRGIPEEMLWEDEYDEDEDEDDDDEDDEYEYDDEYDDDDDEYEEDDDDEYEDDDDDEDEDDEDEEEWVAEDFAQTLVHLFPEGELTRWLPRKTFEFFDGTYILQVAVRRNCWRRIRLSSHSTLHQLHQVIQRAFDFDDDHLYAFFLDGKKWSRKRAFYSPDADEGPVATEACLGELELSAGQTFLYIFDFGDEWEFTITVEDIGPIDTQKLQPQVIESKGAAPEQYGDYD